MSTYSMQYDDETKPAIPLYLPFDNVRQKRFTVPKKRLIGILLTVIIFFILLTTIFSGFLYFKPYKTKLPPFPEPSSSFFGQYSKASVAADNEICSQIGRDVLLLNGNAIDAAIASLFCLGVINPHSAGLGGGHFMTIYNATEKKCHVIDARETAPAAANKTMFDNRWKSAKTGYLAVAVSGELHGLYTAFEKFGSGKVFWEQLVRPTIRLLEEGYPTSHSLAHALKMMEDQIKMEPSMHVFINPETGVIFKAGELIRTRVNLLQTFKMIADSANPIEAFYNSSFTKVLVQEFEENGGIITAEDYANYRSIIRSDESVIYTSFKNNRFACGPPPPSASSVTQSILNIMDGYTFDSISTFDDWENYFHHFIESNKFAFAARSALGDMDFLDNATAIAKNITSREWAKKVRAKITHDTHDDKYYGGEFEYNEDHGTTHVSIIDVDGNAVSVTSTINLILGARVISSSSGILHNDQMDDFSMPNHHNTFGIPPSKANYIEPGKRPMSSMSPIIIFTKNEGINDTNEILVLGSSGGSTIISGVSGVALQSMWLNKNIKGSVDFPRIHNQLRPNVTMIENRMPEEYITKLMERGHTFSKRENIGVVTAVGKEASGRITANSDFRKGVDSECSGY
uniref:Gamma-glutamyltranspeptidase 1 n=1 Tax=Rhabditophanes sp. KR3021 TaxID=114890 RepID=A0AC35TGT7_9BILA